LAISHRLSLIDISEVKKNLDAVPMGEGVISLRIGEPDFDTPQHIKEFAKEALDMGLTHYSESAGMLELREAIAEKLKAVNGIEADPERNIMLTLGANQAFILALGVLLKEGEEVLIPTPAFVTYAPSVSLAGGRPVEVPTSEENEFKIEVEALERHVTPKTRALIINTPNNPTGSVLGRKDLEALADFAAEHELTIISDEVYEHFVYDDVRHYSIASFNGMFDRVITVNGFSKTYAMTGWRLGYVVANEETVEEMVKFQFYVSTCPVTFIQWAAMKALKDPRSKEAVEKMRLEYERRRNLAYKRLNEIGLKAFMPKGSFYIFPNVEQTGLNDKEFSQWMLKDAKVALTPGFIFGKGGENHERISFAAAYETLQEAFHRMEKVIKTRSVGDKSG